MTGFHLDPRALTDDVISEPIRAGFGRGLLAAGEADERVVALCADLTDSTQMHLFKDRFPRRFIQVGVAEQNLVTVASGMARAGKIPFTSSYAAFSPGRNWEQFKTTAALNDQPVTIVGSHAGINVGPDGATHQMLEDIALMRVLPNTRLIAPADSIEAEKATRALAAEPAPGYLRLARDATPVFTTTESPFEIGKAYVLRPGTDVSIITTGTMTYQGLLAADILAKLGLQAEVVHVPTIKPLDEETVLSSIRKTGYAATIEEAQITGGLGSVIAELATLRFPIPIDRFGMRDRFGESGSPKDLLEAFRLTGPLLAEDIGQCFRSRFPDRSLNANSEVMSIPLTS
ncbi:transketolase family protein [Arthrobacter sp. SDTb3-6]|uniref:transketolase family protein n=1 Tax=Arthrobacter sp. SDTb3-6 TaxID=2713571 RepID=UPI00159E0BCD|nr:transketolase C-terminal domain-containing protein [Arthrobacter sp. SDTb3-6]NVM98502.1 transketolase family protein [Arthrobacter sp. SDTb3-6]